MEFAIEEKDGAILLTLSGNLTIQSATKTKDLFLDMLEKTECLQLKFEMLEEVDLSFIQILFAAQKMLEGSKKQMLLEGECPEHLQQMVTDIGYAYQQWFCFRN